MKIDSLCGFHGNNYKDYSGGKKVQNAKNLSFHGMAERASQRYIFGAMDAIKQWEVLKHPKYTNIFQESEKPTAHELELNRQIREFNYNFLNLLTNKFEKEKFIKHFKEITGFPNLALISQKMISEFSRVLNHSAKVNDSRVLISGYDEFCSVGLKTALPGSDIDKGYAIVKSKNNNNFVLMEEEFSNKIKSSIWENIDNRIVSVNHCAAFPNILTDKELALRLARVDEAAARFMSHEYKGEFLGLRVNMRNPIWASKFNILLSKNLADKNDRIAAKNLAYVIETIREGRIKDFDDNYACGVLQPMMGKSLFSWCSNITQALPTRNRYCSEDVLKPKLRERLSLEKQFDTWDIDNQYDLIKDIIRSMSGDNKNSKFSNMFQTKVDKHRLFINDCLTDENIGCYFLKDAEGVEHLYVRLNSGEAAQKYSEFDINSTGY